MKTIELLRTELLQNRKWLAEYPIDWYFYISEIERIENEIKNTRESLNERI